MVVVVVVIIICSSSGVGGVVTTGDPRLIFCKTEMYGCTVSTASSMPRSRTTAAYKALDHA